MKKKGSCFQNGRQLSTQDQWWRSRRAMHRKPDVLCSIIRSSKPALIEEQQTAEEKQHDIKIAEDLEKSFEIEYPDRDNNINSHLVGPTAVTSFYKHYKRLDRIRDQNSTENIRPSVYTSILTKCEQLRILPSKVGLIKYKGQGDSLRLGHSRYGKKYLSALSEGLKEMNVTSCHFNSNKINHETIEVLAPNLPRNVTSMKLQNNEIGFKGIEAFHRFLKEDVKLMELDLSNNNLTDVGVMNLCNTLQNHQRIKILNISRNCVTCKAAPHIASLIQNNGFQQIYLQWNRIRSKGGKDILDALQSNPSVKVFDMSWNLIGNCHETCQSLCNIIRCNSQLLHTDFSGNSFTIQECQQISKALQSNGTIYGFHFKGNFGFIDPVGHLVVESGLNARDYREVSIHQTIQSYQLKQHTRKDVCDMALRDSCWICQGWLEKQITFSAECTFQSHLWVHFSFEGYRSRYLGRVEQVPLTFKCMVPPRKVYFFFTCNDEQITSKAHDTVCLFDNSLIRQLDIAGRKSDCHVEDRNVIHQGEVGQVLDCHYKIVYGIKPRTVEPEYLPTTQEKQSVQYRHPDRGEITVEQQQQQLLKHFNADWSMIKIQRLAANEQVIRIRETLLANYSLIRQHFRYYSCNNITEPNGFYMDSDTLKIFLAQNELLDGDLTQEQVTECLKSVIAATQKELQSFAKAYTFDSITCFRFIELLIQITPLKYSKYDHSKALELLLLNLKKKCIDLQQYQKFQDNVFKPEMCDVYLRQTKTKLEELFFKNCSAHWRLGQKKFIYFEDFKNIFSVNETQQQFQLDCVKLRLAFFYAKRGFTDYYGSDGFRRLFLNEFPEAIARATYQANCNEFRDNHLIDMNQKLSSIIESLIKSR